MHAIEIVRHQERCITGGGLEGTVSRHGVLLAGGTRATSMPADTGQFFGQAIMEGVDRGVGWVTKWLASGFTTHFLPLH